MRAKGRILESRDSTTLFPPSDSESPPPFRESESETLLFIKTPFVKGESSSNWIVCLRVCLKDTFWKEDLLNLTNLGAVYLTQFLTDCRQILDSKSYDQA